MRLFDLTSASSSSAHRPAAACRAYLADFAAGARGYLLSGVRDSVRMCCDGRNGVSRPGKRRGRSRARATISGAGLTPFSTARLPMQGHEVVLRSRYNEKTALRSLSMKQMLLLASTQLLRAGRGVLRMERLDETT